MYEYYGTVDSVYDGDTATIVVHLGFDITHRITLRFFGIDTPEMRGPEKARGKEVRDWVRSQILRKKVVLRTFRDKKGKYGRYLAQILVPQEDGSLMDLNKELVARGMAKEYFGGKRG